MLIVYKTCKIIVLKNPLLIQLEIVLFKELNIINSYTLEASFYKSEFKSMWKVKSEMDKDNSKFLSNGSRKINGSSEDAFDDHFEEIDFINVGRDFVKALSNAASNSVLK